MRLRSLPAAVCLMSVAFCATAQTNFPSRPILLIVPYAPGGGLDMQARTLAESLARVLRQPVGVDNRPGEKGVLGLRAGASARPDGSTLVYVSNQAVVHAYLQGNPSSDILQDLQPIGITGIGPLIVVTRAQESSMNLREFVASLAQRRNRPARFGSNGEGSLAHLAGSALARAGKFQSSHVSYHSMADALAALSAGELDYTVATMASALLPMKAGKVKALAVASPKREPRLPRVPTVAEELPPGFVLEQWEALAAPKGVSGDIVDKLAGALGAYLSDLRGIEALNRGGMRPSGLSPEDSLAYMRAEAKQLERWVQEARIRPGQTPVHALPSEDSEPPEARKRVHSSRAF